MKQFALRLDDDLHRIIRDRAYDNRRSMNSEMNLVLRQHMDNTPKAHFKGDRGQVITSPVVGFEGDVALVRSTKGEKIPASSIKGFLGIML